MTCLKLDLKFVEIREIKKKYSMIKFSHVYGYIQYIHICLEKWVLIIEEGRERTGDVISAPKDTADQTVTLYT